MSTIELVSIAIGIVATVLGGIWFIFSKIFGMGRFASLVDEINNRTCHAACDAHDKDIDNIKGEIKTVGGNVIKIESLCNAFDKDIDNVKIQLDKVNDNLTKINSLLLLKYKDASKVFSVKNSPRKLNEIGEKVYADINGEEFLNANEEFLFSLIDTYHPKTALDVENAAHAVCAVSTENEIFNGIKNYVYNSPSYKMPDDKLYDLTLPDICFVLSLPLRDRYLKAHPEIVSE